MKKRYILFRFTVGRFVIHLGLAIMPPGRVKEELICLMEIWADKVRSVIKHG